MDGYVAMVGGLLLCESSFVQIRNSKEKDGKKKERVAACERERNGCVDGFARSFLCVHVGESEMDLEYNLIPFFHKNGCLNSQKLVFFCCVAATSTHEREKKVEILHTGCVWGW